MKLAMNDQEQIDLVLEADPDFETIKKWAAADVKKEAPHDISAWLRQPKNIQVWYDALVALKQGVEMQLSHSKAELAEKQQECWDKGSLGRKEWFKACKENKHWKRKANHFKLGVERCLREAKRARSILGNPRESVSLVKKMVCALASSLSEESGTPLEDIFRRLIAKCNRPGVGMSMSEDLTLLDTLIKEVL